MLVSALSLQSGPQGQRAPEREAHAERRRFSYPDETELALREALSSRNFSRLQIAHETVLCHYRDPAKGPLPRETDRRDRNNRRGGRSVRRANPCPTPRATEIAVSERCARLHVPRRITEDGMLRRRRSL